jgi:hypothetical protein
MRARSWFSTVIRAEFFRFATDGAGKDRKSTSHIENASQPTPMSHEYHSSGCSVGYNKVRRVTLSTLPEESGSKRHRAIHGVSFSHDGRIPASCVEDQMASVWDLSGHRAAEGLARARSWLNFQIPNAAVPTKTPSTIQSPSVPVFHIGS